MTAMTITNITAATATPEGTPAMIACSSCSIALDNADMTHIAERDLDTVTQNIEEAGRVVMTHYADYAVYVCDFCEYGYSSAAFKYEAV